MQRLTATAETRAGVELQQKESAVAFLDSVKWSEVGLVAVVVQDVDTGEVLMQAYTDRAGITETLDTRLATFYSRSRKGRWCKGETSGNFIRVEGMYLDCDRDSVVYLGEPDGPSCHTGAHTCWFSEAAEQSGEVVQAADESGRGHSPLPTILALEEIIQQRRLDSDSGKKSWTAKLLKDEELLCSKIREEAGELCQSAEEVEGKDRVASEMADLLYHSMVLLNSQGVAFKDVCKVLRSRFGISGVEEKQSRPAKAAAN